jgi:DNA-binding transcriptional LysR family regulator
MKDITLMDVRAVNLNLLVAFDALVEERSVTRAARRIGVSQPALSASLGRLRALFGDPLFRRAAHGLEPTPRALELSGPVRQGLRLLGDALSPPSFDPGEARRTFVILASDYVEFVLLPPLLRRIAAVAPGVTLQLLPWGLHEIPPQLARGEADLLIGFYDQVPPQHAAEPLFEEEYAVILRRRHPTIKKRLTLARYLECGHVLVSEKSGSPGSVDRALAAQGKSRRVAARVSHFLMVPMLVARTDLVAALSRRVAEPFAAALKLQIFPAPLALPKSRIGHAWHQQMTADPGHRWLRAQIQAVARRL